MPDFLSRVASKPTFGAWFAQFAWLVTNITTPIVYAIKLKHEHVEPRQREVLVNQEICRQAVSAGINFTTGAIGILLAPRFPAWKARLLGRPVIKEAATKSVNALLGSALANCLGYAFIRPILGTDLFIRWMRHKNQTAFQITAPSAPTSRLPASSDPVPVPNIHNRMPEFMNNVRLRQAGQPVTTLRI